MSWPEYPTEVMRELVEYHSNFLSERRLEVLSSVLACRTRYMTVVLEDIFQSQNASAVLRTCECYGIQDIHVIENANSFSINPKVVLGASKWLTLHRYNQNESNTVQAIDTLKNKGYRIVATSPHSHQDLHSFDARGGQFALLFGTELNGLTEQAMELADEFISIPMVGFTESLNISVAAAICIYSLTTRLRNEGVDISLPDDQSVALMLSWMRSSIKSWRSIEKRFFSLQKK